MAGYDPADPDTHAVASPDYRAIVAEKSPLTPRFAFVRTPVWDKADAATRAAFEQFAAKLGETCFTLDLPETFSGAWDAHCAVMAVEMAHNLGSIVDRGGDAVSKKLRDFVDEGRKVSASQYLRALEQARALRAAFDDLFEECNAIVTPSARGVAPKGLDSTGDPAFCSLWTLTGLPSLNLPLLSGDDGMPLGVQLVGPLGDDARLLRNANWLVGAVGKKASRRAKS